MQKETECPCTKNECERRNDCVACYTHHQCMAEPVPAFCMRPENRLAKELQERVRARLKAAGLSDGI